MDQTPKREKIGEYSFNNEYTFTVDKVGIPGAFHTMEWFEAFRLKPTPVALLPSVVHMDWEELCRGMMEEAAAYFAAQENGD